MALVFDGLMHLDHLSYAAPVDHLADTVQRIGAALGASFLDGGLHPRFGTRNFILPLAGGTYVEVVAALDHPAAFTAPFGQAVRARADQGGGWMGWVVGVSDITAVERRLGRPAVPGHRVRPDGFDLRWRQIGVLDTMADPALPYFVHWECDPGHHPSAGGVVAISRLEIAGSLEKVATWLGETVTHPLDDVDVRWLDEDGDAAGLVAATFNTGHGQVRID